MPIFFTSNFLNFNVKEISIITACCEKNQFDVKIANIELFLFLKKYSFKNFLKKLTAKKILNKFNYQIKCFFFIFNKKKYNLIPNWLKLEKKLLTQNPSTMTKLVYLKKKSNSMFNFSDVYRLKGEFLIFIFKSKHQGCTVIDLYIFVNYSKITSSIIKRVSVELFLGYFEKNNSIYVKNSYCFFLIKKKQYIGEINNKLIKLNNRNKMTNRRCISLVYVFKSPPCVNCSVITECHVQSIISPFECHHIKKWGENFFD